jgi:hypothetical protein
MNQSPVKKLVLLLVAVACSCSSMAQKLELGLHGGIGFNSIPQNSTDSVLPPSTSAIPAYAVSIKAISNVRKWWQVGIGIDLQQIGRKDTGTRYIFANPASPVYLMVNRKITEWIYAGADFGLMFANSPNYIKYTDNTGSKIDVAYFEPGTGYSTGLRIGYAGFLNRHFDINAELAGHYAKYGYSWARKDNTGTLLRGEDKYSCLYFTVLVGIRLKLFTDPFRQW